MTLPLEVPTALAATTRSEAKIQLNWTDNSTKETSIKIFRKTGAGGTYQLVKTLNGSDIVTYDDPFLTPSTTYFYKIRSARGTQESVDSAEVSATTAPARPSNPVATKISGTRIDFTWVDNSTDETAFIVQRKLGSGTYQSIGKGANVTLHSSTGLAPGTYTFRVQSKRLSAKSNFTTEVTATVP